MAETRVKLTGAQQFARKVIRAYAWSYDTPDGGDIQEWAEELGLIRNVGFDPKRHDDHLGLGLEVGDDWYEFTDLAASRLNTSA